MSFVLGGLVLPKYKALEQEVTEISSKHYTLTGKTKKDLIRSKYRFVMSFENLSNQQFEDIMNVYQTGNATSLLIDERYIQLGTTVSVEISGVSRKWGGNFVDLQLLLEEI